MIPLQTHYGFLIRILHWCNSNSMDSAMENLELTGSQGHIMAYLAHAKEPPCPRDLEAEFHMTHPTVSGLLSRLEKKDFIALRPDAADRRCKRIYVLPRGRECQETMHRTILANEDRLVQGFTQEEQELFARLLTQAIGNMGGNPCKRKHKEESNE